MSGRASAGGLAPLAQTRRELADNMMDHTSDPITRLGARESSLAALAVLGTASVAAGTIAYLAWRARRYSASIRKRQALIAYLRDHLSGSDAALRVVHRLGDLSLLRTFEALAVGVRGKRCMWRALQTLRSVPSTAQGMNFVELEAKAVRQWEAIEERRRALVERTFSAAASRAE
jgi:hypothetical protein